MIQTIPTQSTCYTKVKGRGENVPINIVPSGVKCKICSQMYNIDDLEKHLITHVSAQYVKSVPAYNTSTPDKLKIVLGGEQESQNIWIKSFVANDLPQSQKKRRIVAPPATERVYLRSNQIIGNDVCADTRDDLTSRFGDETQVVESEERLQLKKTILLKNFTEKVKNKEIGVYINNNNYKKPKNLDDRVQSKKSVKEEQIQMEGYQVFTPSKKPIQQSKYTYVISNTVKIPKKKLSITTASKEVQGPTQVQMQSDRDYKLGQSNSTTLVASRMQQTHSCPQCSGFYCNTCKSSVPPKYRPIPDSDGNYHFHGDQHQQTAQFYKRHYKNRANICTSCSRDMRFGSDLHD